jgi:secreted PhoX family phosphatase
MKGRQHPRNDVPLNHAGNDSIIDVIARVDERRRTFLKGSIGASVAAALGGLGLGALPRAAQAQIPSSVGFAGIGFQSVPPNLRSEALGRLENDLVSVPRGYTARVLVAWGDPIMPSAQDFDPSATQDAAAQARQSGMHHDGMHFFPFSRPGGANAGEWVDRRGLLCVNHEYTHEAILHPRGLDASADPVNEANNVGLPGETVTIQKVRKSQAAHGVSIQEIFAPGRQPWRVLRGSRYGRRITANTPMRVSGPAAGHALLRSKKFDIRPGGSFDTGVVNDGFTAYGTVNNCANGYTPWGTYLTCEENWNGYFAAPTLGSVIDPNLFDQKGEIIEGNSRYGISRTGAGYRWHLADPRFDADTNPLEPNLFGWVVEIDPFDPRSTPVKRTAMGRIKHESAQLVVDKDNRVAFYMGDDERNEYIYKFVCRRPLASTNPAANRDMLDQGTLYVAKFNDNGTGVWLPLVFGQNGLTPDNGFADQGEVLIKTRQAADRLGATMMDRPEWTAVRPRTLGFDEIEVYCTLTNNSRRGNNPASANKSDGSTGAATANPPVDAANPRPDNDYGHIIRWREDGRSVAATTFSWDLFVQCGDKKTTKTLPASYNPAVLSASGVYRGDIVGPDDYGAPDGLWFDDFGRLWIQTDQAGDGRGDWVNIGGNVMMCADPNTRQTRRFLTSPTDCEVTGITMTPDHRTMFINIQHPGEGAPPDRPTLTSNWPHTQGYGPSGRPRSATVAITKDDGGIIGT